MKGLLVDNWSLERAFTCFQNNGKNATRYSVELVALVEALALWDNVYYWDNGRAFWKTFIDPLPNCIRDNLHPLKEPTLDYDISIPIINAHPETLISDVSLKYLRLADYFSLSYLPIDERAKFILENNLYSIFNQIYSRTDLFDSIDKDVESYYHHLNNEIRKANMTFSPHCLFQYIIDNCDGHSDVFKVAREIGQEKAVRRFKKWVSSFENEIAIGKHIKVYQIREELQTIENELMQYRPKKELPISIGMPLSLSIN